MGSKNSSMKLISAFLIVIVGISLLGAIVTSTNLITDPTQVSAETLSILPARIYGSANNINATVTFTLANNGLVDTDGWVTDSISITNSSGTSLAGNFTVDYAADTIVFANTTQLLAQSDNSTLVTYQYYPADYLNSAFGRTSLKTVLGFFALAIMLGGVALFYGIAKEEGII